MDAKRFGEMLEENPIVCAVKSGAELDACLDSDCQIVFVLFGSVLEIPATTRRIQEAGKAAVVHVDLIDGLSPREVAVDYLGESTAACGIISTKGGLVKHAKSLGLIAVQRFFILDSLSMQNARKLVPATPADAVEILPGIMPKVIRELVALSSKPIIAGGLIADKEDILAALGAGASAITTTNPAVWSL